MDVTPESSLPADPSTGLTRRRFLSWSLGAIGGYVGLIVGIPIVGYVLGPALTGKKEEWVQLGLVDEYKENQPKMAEFTVFRKDGWIEQNEKKSAWVVAKGNGEFTVFSARCTHLGCAYNWQPEDNRFLCPCHNGQYDVNGKVVGGPPPRPLDTLQTKVENGNLYVVYREFQLGIPSKVEL